MGVVECDAIFVADAGAAEDVEGGPDREVDVVVAEAGNCLEIFEGTGATCVGRWDFGPLGEFLYKVLVNAAAEAFDINGVDEEFVAELSHFGKDFTTQSDIGELLPAVGNDEVLIVAFAATEVEDEALFADFGDQIVEAIPFDAAVAENPGGDDDVGSAGVEVALGIVEVYSAAELEPARVGAEGFERGGFVARAEHDDVTAAELVGFVEIGEPGAGFLGNEIGAELVGIQAAADNLFHATFVEVDTGPKHAGAT